LILTVAGATLGTIRGPLQTASWQFRGTSSAAAAAGQNPRSNLQQLPFLELPISTVSRIYTDGREYAIYPGRKPYPASLIM
jgi:hypothetical protein